MGKQLVMSVKKEFPQAQVGAVGFGDDSLRVSVRRDLEGHMIMLSW